MMRWLAIALLVTGCASQPMTALEPTASEGFSGRLSITQTDRRDSGGFEYTRGTDGQRWSLSGPTGGPLGDLQLARWGSIWTPSKGQPISAADASELTHQALGVALPIEALGPWILQGATQPMQINGWTLQTLKRDDADRPRTIELISTDIRVRAVIKSWQINPT